MQLDSANRVKIAESNVFFRHCESLPKARAKQSIEFASEAKQPSKPRESKR
ncbi:hypothetical protein [Helicobacter sp. 23-1045]